MAVRSIKDVTKALQSQFSAARIPLSLPSESRRMLQAFIDEHDDVLEEDESKLANVELKNFWEKHVGEHPSKAGAFVGVLRELRPVILREADILEWWQQVVKPVVAGTGYRKAALDDATDFLVASMVYDEEDDTEQDRARLSSRLLSDLLKIYVARTRELSDDDRLVAPNNEQVAQQVEGVLTAFGKKQPKDLLHSLDDLLLSADTRLQGLTLLNSFLRHQTPHIYLVINTPLVTHLLQCLMNDTSTTVLSVALTSLIMLLPHIPSSLPAHLPRLFLVYSRLLCWEKFSPLSSETERSLVTDDRVSSGPTTDHGDVGIDPTWFKVRPSEGLVESTTPELMTYFTYLYGLYPLNLTSYIRKPRRFLKNHDFPGANDFDLDQTVIRSRTDQFRQVHLMHPNFYNLTIEEELIDPKWPKADPADVVAECQALCVNFKPALVSPGPPPTSKLPQLPQLPSLANMKNSPQISPSTSHASFRTGHSWRDTQSTAISAQAGDGDSPVLGPHSVQSDDESAVPALRPRSKGTNRTSPSLDDFPQPASMNVNRARKESDSVPQTNIAYLQRENTLLRNELNFERWHKAQYSAHIGQMMRKNVKDATAEAESLNLINANRALKLQLDQVRKAREATVDDSALTRKRTNNMEATFTDRFTKLRQEQETWRADAADLKRLRNEIGQYRDLLVTIEQRELNKSHQLEIVKRQLENMEDTQKKLEEAQRKLREYEYREFDMEQTKREMDVLMHEKDSLQMRVQRHLHDHERTRQSYAERISELEAQLNGSGARRGMAPAASPDTQALVQHAVADSQAKLNQLRKKHTALMERYTDLEMEYESIKEQLDAVQGSRGRNNHTFPHDGESYNVSSRDHSMSGALSSRDGAYSDLNGFTDNAYITSASDPSGRRYQPKLGGAFPVSPPASDATLHSTAGLTWRPPLSRQDSIASRGSSVPGGATTYNQTAPLRLEETSQSSAKSTFSDGSNDAAKRGEKIKPDSQVRVYGRGGAQNIKMKSKDKDGAAAAAAEKPEKEKKIGGFRSLKRLV
ncbi:hypothetical protein LTR53_012557 [Teratosphaeriaceae sp. CCFEE 6253]|nr:hypothetical protein LTR53_012557 [Teratosphaeriaceae sp. CCFEE 6253]